MTARRKKLSTLVAALVVGWGGSAHAGVIAQSVLEVTDFMFTSVTDNNTLGPALDLDQFDSLVFQDSTDALASLNGATESDSLITTQFGTLDLPQQCVGDCVFGENDYTHHNVATVTVARGDTLLTGSPIDIDGAVGADAHTLAEVQLQTEGDEGSAQSNLGLVATFSFVLNESQRLGISGEADQWLIAFLTNDMALGTTAQASSAWTISLAQGGTTLFNWTPNGVVGTGIDGGTELADACDLTRTVAAQVPGQEVIADCSGRFAAFTDFVLDAGLLYTINLRHTTEADAVAGVAAVPEPSVVALLGIGLLGMGLGKRRGRRAAE